MRTRAVRPDIELANEVHWITENLDRALCVRIVDRVTEAIEHINSYGSGFTVSGN